MIVDMRLRPPLPTWVSKPQFNEAVSYYPTRVGFPRPPSVAARSMDLLLKEMDEAEITWGVVMGRQAAEPLPGQGAVYDYNCPVHLFQPAKDFPDLNIIVSHGGWPWVRELLGIAFSFPNIYVSPDLYLNSPSLPGANEYVMAANMYMGDRLLFGTAYPSRPLPESVVAFNHWSFAPGVKEKVLGQNALRVMNMN